MLMLPSRDAWLRPCRALRFERAFRTCRCPVAPQLAALSTTDEARGHSLSRTEIRAGDLLCEPSRLFVFVGFSDDRLVVRFGVVVFVLVIIIVIVGDSRRHRVAHRGNEAPVDR